ncbi:MAG: hypothetical protein PHP92_03935 [Candidatus Nanoarchaeia archaeon]|nr:hypothetical protein [Candidatus Nanoarchaeia archaeon]
MNNKDFDKFKEIFYNNQEELCRNIYLSELIGEHKNDDLLEFLKKGLIKLYGFADITYEGRFRALACIFKGFLDGDQGGKTLGLNSDFNFILSTLIQTIIYCLNSTSFKDKKLHDFDKLEIIRKLKRIVPE